MTAPKGSMYKEKCKGSTRALGNTITYLLWCEWMAYYGHKQTGGGSEKKPVLKCTHNQMRLVGNSEL